MLRHCRRPRLTAPACAVGKAHGSISTARRRRRSLIGFFGNSVSQRPRKKDRVAKNETCEPFICRAYRRTREVLTQRRDQRDADYDPLFDEEKAEFHVCDVAILREELRHLAQLERKLVSRVNRERARPFLRLHSLGSTE